MLFIVFIQLRLHILSLLLWVRRTRYYSTKNGINNINPVVVYTNSDTQKLEILKDNKGKSGIYLWKNEKNGKLYVGSAQDITRRLRQYYSIYYLAKDSGMYISRALLKDGYSSFSLYILEYCDEKYLIQREQYI